MTTKIPAHFATSPSSVRRRASTIAVLAPLLALLALAAGCTNEFTCLDLGCDPGYRCDPETEECIEREDACEEGTCPSDRVCNLETGECEPKTQSCQETGSCPNGQVCNGRTGFCVPEAACSANDCGDAERCDEETGECVPKPCGTDAECPRSYICSEAGICTTGCRLDTPNCPPGQRCWPVTETTGQCLNRCTSHRDCPHGQYCATESGDAVCRPEGPCNTDEDCRRSDEVCRNGVCAAPPCQSNDECPSTQACDRATGLCVGGNCSDDSFAPNQTRQEATSLDFETFTGLQLCPGKNDWFLLDAASAESIAIGLEHDADRDLDFTVFAGDGDVVALNQQPPARRRGIARPSISFLSERDQTLAIRVYSDDRASPSDDGDQTPQPPVPEPARYQLTVERTADLVCQDDRSEENDDRREAETLPSDIGSEPKYPFLKICGGDADWFRLPEVRRRAQLRAEVQSAPTHIELEILSEHGAHFTRRPNKLFHLRRNATRQDWFFRVTSNRRLSAGYNLTYAVDSEWRCPQAGAYGDAAHAVALAPDERSTFLLCPSNDGWEDDWVELQAPSSTSYLDLRVLERSGSPPLDVTLFERRDDKLGLLRTTKRRNGVHGAALEVDPSQEIVVRIVSSEAPGNLTETPNYDVVYKFEDESG